MFQHTAARRRLVGHAYPFPPVRIVSTHSRPKAAGFFWWTVLATNDGFNTQPPEGGWFFKGFYIWRDSLSFNTQPPEGGWNICWNKCCYSASFNTQPPEGGWRPIMRP